MGPGEPQLAFSVLGPLEVHRDGTALQIATRRQRALLLLLLLDAGRPVPAERLVDRLWDGEPPPQATVTLRSYVSNVRQALGGRDRGGSVLVTRGQGYALQVPVDAVDAARFHALVDQGRAQLRDQHPRAALESFEAAEQLWRGDPYAEIADHEVAQGARAQLVEMHLGAIEGRFEALLAVGRHRDALAELESFVADHPMRETPRALLMLAMYRSGRAAEALEVYRSYREGLADELGLDPGTGLVELQQQILRQDAELVQAPTPTPAPTAVATGRSVVGRDQELDWFAARLDSLVAARSGGLVLIGGEAGIGKTTMLDAASSLGRDRGIEVHAGRSPSGSGAPAFWPWTQVLESLAASMDDAEISRLAQGNARLVTQLSPTITDRLGQQLPATGDNVQGMRFLLHQAVTDFLRGASDRPMLVILDDLHWADIASLELLSYLAPALVEMPVLVLAAYRDIASDRPASLDDTLATVSREDAVEELTLGGLDAESVVSLAHSVVGHDRAGAIVTEIAALHERTGGNPFFVRQLARTLLENVTTGRGATSVPPGVRHIIDGRLRSLQAGDLAVLEAASLLGREFDLRVVAGAAGVTLPDALDTYDRSVAHGLVEPGTADTGYRFVHALVQEAVADAVAPGRATKLQAAIAVELERLGAPLDQVAEHMWLGRELLGARGVPHLLASADAAASVFAHERAEEFLRRALSLAQASSPPDPATELRVLLALFRLIASARGWGAAEAREVVGRARGLVEVSGWSQDTLHLWWSMFFFLIDRDDEPAYSEVARTLLVSLESARVSSDTSTGGDVPGHAAHAAVHLMNIFPSLADDDREAALTHLRAARTHVEESTNAELAAFDEHLHVMLLLIEGFWAAFAGDAETNRATTLAAIALADADGRPFPRAVARTLGASSAPYVGEAAFVHEVIGPALELDRRFGFEWLATVAETLHTWSDARLHGATTEAAQRISDRLEDMAAAGRGGTASLLLVLLADVLALCGETDRARDSLRRAEDSPGPYRGLARDLVRRTLDQLDPG